MTGMALTALAALPLVLVLEDLPVPQQWTVLGILGFVLAGVTWLLQNVGSRLARVIERLNETNSALVMELRALAKQNEAFQEDTMRRHEEYAREREKAVAEIKDAIHEALRGRERR